MGKEEKNIQNECWYFVLSVHLHIERLGKNNDDSFCLRIDRTQNIIRKTSKIQDFYFLSKFFDLYLTIMSKKLHFFTNMQREVYIDNAAKVLYYLD